MTNAHPAATLIGAAYRRGAHGPHEFDCWGLVRHVFETVHGVVMPVIAVGQQEDASAENVAAIKGVFTASGWRPSGAREPLEDDIVLMNGIGGRHVGVMVAANDTLLFLHCIEPQGVCAQPLVDLSREGFSGFTFWRRA